MKRIEANKKTPAAFSNNAKILADAMRRASLVLNDIVCYPARNHDEPALGAIAELHEALAAYDAQQQAQSLTPSGTHAAEPWQVVYSITGQPLYIWDANENELCEMNRGDDTARRIVACVNACAGISTEELEGRAS